MSHLSTRGFSARGAFTLTFSWFIAARGLARGLAGLGNLGFELSQFLRQYGELLFQRLVLSQQLCVTWGLLSHDSIYTLTLLPTLLSSYGKDAVKLRLIRAKHQMFLLD